MTRSAEILSSPGLQQSLRRLKSWNALTLGTCSLALVLYLAGLKPLLLVLLIAVNAVVLPMPAVVSSLIARAIIGLLFTVSLVQIAAAAQQILFPASRFAALAALLAVAEALVLLMAPRRGRLPRPLRVVDVTDGGALLVVAFFVVPFAVVLAQRHFFDGVAQLAGVQSADAIHHWGFVADMLRSQHLDYSVFYYPKGFHISVAFFEDALLGNVPNLGWRLNVVLYLLQYLAFGALFAWLCYLLCVRWLRRFAPGDDRSRNARARILAAVCLGPPLALMYLIPFVTNGFVNYFYMGTAIVASLLYVLELPAGATGPGVLRDRQRRWLAFAGLILLFGASSSWPLLIPPTVLTVLLSLSAIDLRSGWRVTNLIRPANLALVGAMGLQALPIYFQLHFATGRDTSLLNQTGGLSHLNAWILLAGAAAVGTSLLARSVARTEKHGLIATFVPLFAFVGGIVLEQYHAVGEVRYYAVKASWFLEVLCFVLGVAALLSWALRRRAGVSIATAVTALPLAVIVGLGLNSDNLRDTKLLLSGPTPTPGAPYFFEDARAFAALGSSGRLTHAIATSIHADALQRSWYALMGVPYWANMMSYDSSPGAQQVRDLFEDLYGELTFVPASVAQQNRVKQDLTRLELAAHTSGERLYIVTDPLSAPLVERTFGKQWIVVD